MKTLFGGLFLLANILCIVLNFSGIPALVTLSVLLLLIGFFSKKEGNQTIVVLTEMMIYSWSCGWMNIFGKTVESMHLPFIYLIGFAIVMYGIYVNRTNYDKSDLLLVVILVTLEAVTIILHNSDSLSGALTEVITFVFVFAVAISIKSLDVTITQKEYDGVLKSYVNANIFTAIGITVQAVIQIVFEYNFIYGVDTVYLGQTRIITSLLFLDASSASIFVAIAVFVLIKEYKRFKFAIPKMVIILVGITLTSTRTGIVSLFILLGLFALFYRERIGTKLLKITGIAVLGLVTLYALESVRVIEEGMLLDDTGRVEGYIAALELYFNSDILFGVGYGRDMLYYLTGEPVPHFVLLKFLVQGGLLHLIVLLIYLVKQFFETPKVGIGRYLFIGTAIGSCFIPDIFAAKFLVIYMAIMYFEQKLEDKQTLKIGELNG